MLGGTQFIGRATVRRLLSRGHQVALLNRGKSPHDFGDSVELIKCDRRRQPTRVRSALARGWDAVVDLINSTSAQLSRCALVRVYVYMTSHLLLTYCPYKLFIEYL